MKHPITESHDQAPLYCRSAVSAIAALDRQENTVAGMADAWLARIAQREPAVHAWVWHEAEAVRRQADRLDSDANLRSLPLRGVAVGVKDIIDTADMPTAYGSRLYSGHRPAADATVVARLRAAGAVIAGKTATTEFAYVHPAATTNPHNAAHTPGGSSSGSAAAVADGMVQIALGTQTGGSTIRPSAYCGVVGFKPTFGRVPLTGVKPLAPSMDTIGIHARCVADAAIAFPVLLGESLPPPATVRVQGLRVAFYPGPFQQEADADARRVLAQARDLMAGAGMAIGAIDLPDALFGGLSEANRSIMTFEAGQACAEDYRRGRELLGQPTRELIEHGQAMAPAQYRQALDLAQQSRAAFAEAMQAFDVLLTFSAPGEAPLMAAGTGNSIFNRAWTTIGTPCLTLPTGRGAQGLPLGIQLVGACGDDARLLAIGKEVEQLLGSAARGAAQA